MLIESVNILIVLDLLYLRVEGIKIHNKNCLTILMDTSLFLL